MQFLEQFAGFLRFESVVFLAFLAVSVLGYFALPGVRTRTAWMLLINVGFFLLVSPRSLAALTAVTTTAYVVGLLLGPPTPDVNGTGTPRRRRAILVVGILLMAGALLSFKYWPLLAATINGLSIRVVGSSWLSPAQLLLPLGISFWTFQSIAYVVDVFKGVTPPVRSPFLFAQAVTFFPTVTAGPITKVQSLVSQLDRHNRFSYDDMHAGLMLIAFGFFKKLMVADRLAVFVNTVFDSPRNYVPSQNGLVFLVAASFFAIQLYCDFSAYTDIVRGAARIFGVHLPLNFRAPYFASSVRDFWRRWHMSLMDWFREYIYFPLGGNRRGTPRKYLNLMIVFTISGLWHAAGFGLQYVVWGLLNGVYVVAGEAFAPLRDRVVRLLRIDRSSVAHRVFQSVLTFFLITVAWVFFRAQSIDDALYMLQGVFSPTVWVFTDNTMVSQGLTYSELLIALVSAIAVGIVDWLALSKDLLAGVRRQHLVYRWAFYYGLIAVIVVFGHYGGAYNAADFVYFKF